MILTLEVTGPQAQQMGAAARKVFKAIGGTIGRLPDNDWVFPDPYVSGRHALIRYVNDKFFVEDTSTNGVFVNSRDNRLKRGQAHQLRDGDRLYIDAYQIGISIQKDSTADSRNDPFAGLQPGTTRLKPPPPPRPAPTPPPAGPEDRTAGLAVLGSSHSRNGTVVDESTVVIEDEDDDEEEDDESEDHATEWFGGAEMADPKKNVPGGRPEIVKATVAVPLPV